MLGGRRNIEKKNIVSRSGTLTYEAVAQLSELGIGQSSAVGVGGDLINGLKHIDIMLFFFSSRRRHTRLQGDWSSDVCSSDLGMATLEEIEEAVAAARKAGAR